MPAASDIQKWWKRDPASYRSCSFLPVVFLFLAFRAPERRAAVLHEAPHHAAAAGGPAGLALAVVDFERVLEIAEFARGQAMVADRGAASLDRLVQHGVDRTHHALGVIGGIGGFLRSQRRWQPPRRQLLSI